MRRKNAIVLMLTRIPSVGWSSKEGVSGNCAGHFPVRLWNLVDQDCRLMEAWSIWPPFYIAIASMECRQPGCTNDWICDYYFLWCCSDLFGSFLMINVVKQMNYPDIFYPLSLPNYYFDGVSAIKEDFGTIFDLQLIVFIHGPGTSGV